jgi:predicted nucleic acid-binding protein
VVCTRPIAVNGLGKNMNESAAELTHLKGLFTLLDDTPALFPTWEKLVTTNNILGKNAHDARLVAAMLVHNITHLLTFNDSDFRRFSGITVLTPGVVLSAVASPPTVSQGPNSPPIPPAIP